MAEFLYHDAAERYDRTEPREACPHCGSMVHGSRRGNCTFCESCGEILGHEPCVLDSEGRCHLCQPEVET